MDGCIMPLILLVRILAIERHRVLIDCCMTSCTPGMPHSSNVT